MTPEERDMNMEELNNRRMERYLQRQQNYAKKRKKKMLILIASACLAVLGLAALFFLLRMEDAPAPEVPNVTASAQKIPEDATVIHLVAAGDVNVTDAIVASGGAEFDYTDTFLDVAHLLADGDTEA